MPFTLTMPKLSPTMEEGTIAQWHKKVGNFVEVGDVLFEVTTDKATVEYNAIDKGFLRQILVKENEDAVVNQAVAIFTEKGDESIEGYQPEGIKKKEEAVAPEAKAETGAEETEEKLAEKAPAKGAGLQQPAFVPEPPLENYVFGYASEARARVVASPLARKLAKEKGLDLSTVKGSGPNQRIMSRDLERAQSTGNFVFGKREVPSETPGSYEEEAMSPMRKVIAQRLQEAKTFVPHFYVTQTINAEPLLQLREQLRQLELKVSVNDLVIRACALALRDHPVINSGFNSVTQKIIRFKTIDISVAVSIEGGLITPIVRHADYKNIGEISREVRALAGKAKEGKLSLQEFKGGSFTISNLGMFGVTEFQAIISPPQAGILAVSAVVDAPVVRNGAVVPGKTMNVTLSVDHRVVDGVAAAEFIRTVQKYLEIPASLIL